MVPEPFGAAIDAMQSVASCLLFCGCDIGLEVLDHVIVGLVLTIVNPNVDLVFLSAAAEEDFIDPTTGNTLNATAVCLFWLNEAEVVEAARISTIQTTLNQRLSTAATAGDAALMDDITSITDDTPEVAVVILADTGADPLNYPYLVCNLAQHSFLFTSLLV